MCIRDRPKPPPSPPPAPPPFPPPFPPPSPPPNLPPLAPAGDDSTIYKMIFEISGVNLEEIDQAGSTGRRTRRQAIVRSLTALVSDKFGLDDDYIRVTETRAASSTSIFCELTAILHIWFGSVSQTTVNLFTYNNIDMTVSYTHLTLPTTPYV